MFKSLKNFFKLTTWKRWAIIGFTFLASITLITVGSVFLLDKTKPTIDYQNGAQIVFKIKEKDNNIIDNENQLNKYKNDLVERLNLLLPTNSYQAILNDDSVITLKITNIKNDNDFSSIKEVIQKKSDFFILNTNATENEILNAKNNIFYFTNATLNGTTINLEAINIDYFKNFVANDKYMIIQKKDELLKMISENNDLKNDYISVGKNLFKFLFFNPEDLDSEAENKKAILKTKKFGGFDANEYLVSVNQGSEYKQLSIGSSFALKNDYYKGNNDYYKNLFSNLNYAVASYEYDFLSSSFISPTNGDNAFLYLLIATGIVLGAVSIYLVVSYGLLGSLSTISLALLVFLGLLMISIFRGDYDPLTILVVIISSFVALITNIGFFDRIKKEVKNGLNIDKAVFKANKLTFKSSLFTSFSLILIALIIFLVGDGYLKTFAAILLTQFTFNFLISFLGIRFLTKLMTKTQIFEKSPKTLGFWMKPSVLEDIKLTNEIEYKMSLNNPFAKISVKRNYLKTSKWIFLGLGIFLIGGLVAFTTLASINQSALKSFNLNNTSINKKVYQIIDPLKEGITSDKAEKIRNELINKYHFNSNEIKKELVNMKENKYLISISSNKNFTDDLFIQFKNDINDLGMNLVDYSLRDSDTNKKMINSLYIALFSIIAMSVFVIFRYKYSVSIALFVSMILSVASLFLIFISFQIPISILFAPILIMAIIITLINSMTIINRVKEKMKNKKNIELQKIELQKIVNDSLRDKLMEIIKINTLFILILSTFSVFLGAIHWTVAVSLIIFTIISVLISFFILPWIYVFFETFRIRRKRNKIVNNYWDTEIVKEQIFPGFNDIK
ncbi:MAG: hypothetical protein ACRCRZ_03090 [Metamycoplasmataceae bacterium]